MGIKNQTDTIATTSPTVTGTIIPWFTTVLLVVMMGMFMRILDCHTIVILMLITPIQVLTIHIIIME